MLKICLKFTQFNMTKIEGCLKILKIEIPTTKKEIKCKYLQLAKQLHPDTKDSENLQPQKLHQRNEAFIQITKAYKYLNDLSERQINDPQTQTNSDEYFDQNPTRNSENKNEEYSQPLSEQQRTRRTTYAYFNRRYKRQHEQASKQSKQPIYRQIPQFFAGCLLVVAFFIEWGYTAIKRSTANLNTTKKEDHKQVIQNLGFKQKFQRIDNMNE